MRSGECPYRRFHEFDADGLCIHCYQSDGVTISVGQAEDYTFHAHTWEVVDINTCCYRCRCGAALDFNSVLKGLLPCIDPTPQS